MIRKVISYLTSASKVCFFCFMASNLFLAASVSCKFHNRVNSARFNKARRLVNSCRWLQESPAIFKDHKIFMTQIPFCSWLKSSKITKLIITLTPQILWWEFIKKIKGKRRSESSNSIIKEKDMIFFPNNLKRNNRSI